MNFSNQIKQFLFTIILILFIELVKFSLASDRTPLLGSSRNKHTQRNIPVPSRFNSNYGGSGSLRSHIGQQVGGRWTVRNNKRSGNSQRRNSGRRNSG